MSELREADVAALEEFSSKARDEVRSLIKEAEKELAVVVRNIVSAEIERAAGEIATLIEGTTNAAHSIDAARSQYRSPIAGSGGGSSMAGYSFGDMFGSSDSVIGRALGKAMDKAISQIIRKGKIEKRKVIKAGADVIGDAIGGYIGGNNAYARGGSIRLSRGQMAMEVAGDLQRARRNS